MWGISEKLVFSLGWMDPKEAVNSKSTLLDLKEEEVFSSFPESDPQWQLLTRMLGLTEFKNRHVWTPRHTGTR